MRVLYVVLAATVGLAAQQGGGAGQATVKVKASGDGTPRTLSPVQFNANGWPVGGRTPGTSSSRNAPSEATSGAAVAPAPVAEVRVIAEGTRAQPLPSGMQSSALSEVYRATGTPGQLARLGGVVATWKLTVHAEDGGVVGERTYVHVADSATPERDRLQYGDRVFVRDGARVLAGRGGIRWESLDPMARRELQLFGLHLRFPWCYGASERFVVLRQDASSRRGQQVRGLIIEQRVTAEVDVFGPPRSARTCDRFHLYYDALTGTPRELEHRFAALKTRRRALLADWRQFEGVRFPARRVYVDELDRPMTTIELVDLRRRPVDDRDFRLL